MKRSAALFLAAMALSAGEGARAAAVLCATVNSSPQLASTGHTVEVIAEVMNCGDSDAMNVVPCDTIAAGCPVPSCVAVAETSPGSVSLLSGPVPSCTAYLVPGGRAKFTWEYLLNTAGNVWFTVTFTGQQEAAPDVSASDSSSLLILNGASLSATLAVDPACPPDCSLDYRQVVTVRLDVSNTGQVAASAVCPAPLSTEGPGGFTILSAPSCAPSLGAGSAHSFSWSVMASSPGTVTVYSSASGQDEFGAEALTVSSNCSSIFLDVVAPSILSMTLTGSPVLMRGEEAEFRVTATNISSTMLCQSGFALALNGASSDISLVSVSPLLTLCYEPGRSRDFTLRVRLSENAPGGPGVVTVSAVGSEQWTLVPLLSECGALPVVVFEGSPGIADISANPYRVLKDGKLRIRYFLGSEQAGHNVSIKIYSLAGELVETLVDETQASGGWEALWDGRNSKGQTIASGVYIIMFEARFCRGLRKLAVIK